jgi:hypothetical protein
MEDLDPLLALLRSGRARCDSRRRCRDADLPRGIHSIRQAPYRARPQGIAVDLFLPIGFGC